jgi:hypothetical protein
LGQSITHQERQGIRHQECQAEPPVGMSWVTQLAATVRWPNSSDPRHQQLSCGKCGNK